MMYLLSQPWDVIQEMTPEDVDWHLRRVRKQKDDEADAIKRKNKGLGSGLGVSIPRKYGV